MHAAEMRQPDGNTAEERGKGCLSHVEPVAVADPNQIKAKRNETCVRACRDGEALDHQRAWAPMDNRTTDRLRCDASKARGRRDFSGIDESALCVYCMRRLRQRRPRPSPAPAPALAWPVVIPCTTHSISSRSGGRFVPAGSQAHSSRIEISPQVTMRAVRPLADRTAAKGASQRVVDGSVRLVHVQRRAWQTSRLTRPCIATLSIRCTRLR